jgi:hypothetical protein
MQCTQNGVSLVKILVTQGTLEPGAEGVKGQRLVVLCRQTRLTGLGATGPKTCQAPEDILNLHRFFSETPGSGTRPSASQCYAALRQTPRQSPAPGPTR